jgi:hypothetical protein
MKARGSKISETDERSRTAPRDVRIVQKGLLWIAVPVEEGPLLEEATVDAVRRKIRARRLS